MQKLNLPTSSKVTFGGNCGALATWTSFPMWDMTAIRGVIPHDSSPVYQLLDVNPF